MRIRIVYDLNGEAMQYRRPTISDILVTQTREVVTRAIVGGAISLQNLGIQIDAEQTTVEEYWPQNPEDPQEFVMGQFRPGVEIEFARHARNVPAVWTADRLKYQH